ncbi:uncharacterized protein LOC133351998 [Lethenteron reissneri]|uniref:uncharacterized protein LOC133351998 n=1 Tax=Lethenteron reissneri TaxID=7753 RepID=UPI001BB565DB|nr:uncharacterized protein LOC133351998 [Lethenteron reissneri]QTG40766.1 ITAM-containing immunogloblin superfamily receptor [Lethenteron camtschaticum]
MLPTHSLWLLLLIFSQRDVCPCCASNAAAAGEGQEVHCSGYEAALSPSVNLRRVVWHYKPASGPVPFYTYIIDYNYDTKLTDTLPGTHLSDRIKILTEGNSKNSLFIKSFNASDGGTYTCKIYGDGFKLLYTTSVTLPMAKGSVFPLILGAAAAAALFVVVTSIIIICCCVRKRHKVARKGTEENTYTHLRGHDPNKAGTEESHYEMIDVHGERDTTQGAEQGSEHGHDTPYESLKQHVVNEGAYETLAPTAKDPAAHRSPDSPSSS